MIKTHVLMKSKYMDFLLQIAGSIIPLEVKAEKIFRQKGENLLRTI